MKPKIILCLLLLAGISLAVVILREGAQPPLKPSLETVFTLLGKPVKSLDRLISRVLPLDEIDEATLGVAMRERLLYYYGERTHEATPYVQALLDEITRSKQKNFDYQVFIVSGPANAFAMPGGTLVVTTGLLGILQSEAQLVSILGHEVGHVERGHCFDKFRAEMLGKKFMGATLGKIADAFYHLIIASSFSKTQETESDEYGFETLTTYGYAPQASSEAFVQLQSASPQSTSSSPLKDYLRTHPSTELRIEHMQQRALQWWKLHSDARMYVGKSNYTDRVIRSQRKEDAEFMMGP